MYMSNNETKHQLKQDICVCNALLSTFQQYDNCFTSDARYISAAYSTRCVYLSCKLIGHFKTVTRLLCSCF